MMTDTTRTWMMSNQWAKAVRQPLLPLHRGQNMNMGWTWTKMTMTVTVKLPVTMTVVTQTMLVAPSLLTPTLQEKRCLTGVNPCLLHPVASP